MRQNRWIAVLVAVALAAPAAMAGELVKFKDWSSSPQAYFLTKAEREQWSSVKDDASAEQFVQTYLAARGPEFAQELKKRIELADKYLTVGKTPGSQSMRGKVIILLGPPASMDVAVKAGRAAARSGSMDMAFSSSDGGGAGGGSGTSLSDAIGVAQRDNMAAGDSGLRDYTFSFTGDKLPTKKNLIVTVEVNATTGKDRIANKKAAEELESVFETVARASVSKTASK